jgi:hypothetical protein
MGISRGRMSHWSFIREARYSTKSSIKRYVYKTWLPKAQKEIGLDLRIRVDNKYFAVLISNRKHKNIFAFIDRNTGEILRPKTNRKPHTRYQPKATKDNINDKSGGMRYVKNVKFRYLP